MLFFLLFIYDLMYWTEKEHTITTQQHSYFFVSPLHLTLQCVLLHYLLFVNVEVE